EQYGHMVRAVGQPEVIEAPYDPDFNQHAKTPVLVRHVEMFQWREVRLGEQVHYEVDWVDRPVDSSRFAQPGGHENPGTFPIEGKQFDAGLVRLNGLALAPALLHALPGSETVAPETSNMPANMAATFTLYDGYLVTSAKPGHPRLGDIRVSWEAVPLQTLTVFARVDGDRLVPAADVSDGKGFEVQVGDRRLDDVLPDVPSEPALLWARRVIAVLLGALGVFLLLQGRSRDVLLAAGIGVLAIGAVAGACWIGGDGMHAVSWLLVAAIGAGVAAWRVRVLRAGE
ncbi:MAG TPA: TMEM43 family protein, partial [Dyella sp.]|uniref:TMEM43 family protein n=1 Tax=Dyella sp. TaxID=1869338 RepID=UPI002F94C950